MGFARPCQGHWFSSKRLKILYVVMALANTKMTQDPIGHYRWRFASALQITVFPGPVAGWVGSAQLGAWKTGTENTHPSPFWNTNHVVARTLPIVCLINLMGFARPCQGHWFSSKRLKILYVVMALANTKMTQDPIGHYRWRFASALQITVFPPPPQTGKCWK